MQGFYEDYKTRVCLWGPRSAYVSYHFLLSTLQIFNVPILSIYLMDSNRYPYRKVHVGFHQKPAQYQHEFHAGTVLVQPCELAANAGIFMLVYDVFMLVYAGENWIGLLVYAGFDVGLCW